MTKGSDTGDLAWISSPTSDEDLAHDSLRRVSDKEYVFGDEDVLSGDLFAGKGTRTDLAAC